MYIRIRNKQGRKKNRQFKLYSLLYVQPIFFVTWLLCFFHNYFLFLI